MQVRAAFWLSVLFGGPALGGELPSNFADAQTVWERTTGSVAYQRYAEEFAQFNNHFHLDQKDGCYALGQDHVQLALVITHPRAEQFAVVERVLSDVDSEKARCFRRSYKGVRTKVPPFVPFVLHMSMQ